MLKRDPNRKPSLPGAILHEMYLRRSGITIKAFADAIGVTPKHMSNVIHGKARIEAELATRIGTSLGTSIELWLDLQKDVDVWTARQKMRGWKPKKIFHPTPAHV